MARSLADIQADLVIAYQARRDALQGKTVRIDTSAGSRSVGMEDLDKINEMIKDLEQEESAISALAICPNKDPNVRIAKWS